MPDISLPLVTPPPSLSRAATRLAELPSLRALLSSHGGPAPVVASPSAVSLLGGAGGGGGGGGDNPLVPTAAAAAALAASVGGSAYPGDDGGDEAVIATHGAHAPVPGGARGRTGGGGGGGGGACGDLGALAAAVEETAEWRSDALLYSGGTDCVVNVWDLDKVCGHTHAPSAGIALRPSLVPFLTRRKNAVRCTLLAICCGGVPPLMERGSLLTLCRGAAG